MPDLAYRNDSQGTVWFTVAQAAAFTGRAVQTIYSWERRHVLTDPRHDERGRRVYTQAQVAAAERRVRAQAAPRLTTPTAKTAPHGPTWEPRLPGPTPSQESHIQPIGPHHTARSHT